MYEGSQEDAITNIWMVTREYEGLAGAGGVKDVCRQLANALARSGRAVSVVLPLYGFMKPAELGFVEQDRSFTVNMPYVGVKRLESVSIWAQKQAGVTVYLVDAERYREKQGVYTYTVAEEAADPARVQGIGHYDYFAMNVLLQKAAVKLMCILGERPSVIHCQDGHTAILPAMIRHDGKYRDYFRQSGVLVTIHNAGQGYHQEVDDLLFAQTICGLPRQFIIDNTLDGKFDPFLAASSFAVLNTVSENYARELQETDDDALTGGLGHQLLARGVRLEGITNGITPADFDTRQPEKLGLPAAFDPRHGKLAGKKKCRYDLVRTIAKGGSTGVSPAGGLGLRPDQPLFTMIGRLMVQKGVDILVEALHALLPRDKAFQVLILGTGAKEIEADLVGLAEDKRNEGRICVLRGYDTVLANQIYAAGDFFLIPSRYEPCGLTDFIAQLAGNIPIVHQVGGLVKVVDGVTGFAYKEHSVQALMDTMQRAMKVFREQPDMIRTIQQTAVAHIHKYYTWDVVMEKYLRLYHRARHICADVNFTHKP